MTRIGFVRHAEPYAVSLERGKLNPGLTDRGLKQARVLGNSGRLTGFNTMYVSTARRAWETALILYDCTGILPRAMHGLSFVKADRCVLGDAAAAIMNTPPDKWPEVWLQNWGGLEKPGVFLERVRSALREIASLAGNDDVLIVAHAETFWAIMAIVEGITMGQAIGKKMIGHAELHVFEPKEDI